MYEKKEVEDQSTNQTTRERLLEAALNLFSQKGYSATSVDEIAESIGIKGPNIYKYFKGKEALFEELTRLADISYKKNMDFEGPTENRIKSGQELKEFSMRQLRFTITDDKIKKLRKMSTIEQFRSEQMSKQATFHQFTNIENLFTGVLAGMMEDGIIDKCDPQDLALELFAPSSLLIQLCDREPDREAEVLNRIERHLDFFVKHYCH